MTVELDTPSSIGMLEAAGELVGHLAATAGFDLDSSQAIQVALHEALVNAIVHGNDEDETRRVNVELAARADGLAVRVRDEGRGFDPSRVPDPLAPESLCKPSGRGIFLMRMLMDEVAFRQLANGGMEVTMRKRHSVCEERIDDGQHAVPASGSTLPLVGCIARPFPAAERTLSRQERAAFHTELRRALEAALGIAGRSSRGVGGRCEFATTVTSRAGRMRPFVADLRRFARSARWHASCSRGEHEPCEFADRTAPRWTHDDGVAPLSKESQPSLLAAAAVCSRSGDAAGAGASDAASARRTAAQRSKRRCPSRSTTTAR